MDEAIRVRRTARIGDFHALAELLGCFVDELLDGLRLVLDVGLIEEDGIAEVAFHLPGEDLLLHLGRLVLHFFLEDAIAASFFLWLSPRS
jgi:hypothetical protein